MIPLGTSILETNILRRGISINGFTYNGRLNSYNQHHHPQKSHFKLKFPERLDMKQHCCNELQSESGRGNVIIPMLITP